MQGTVVQLQLPLEISPPLKEKPVPFIPIYTLGYGNRSIDQFLELLEKYPIEFLADVRSQPYSRANPSFSREMLERVLKSHNVRYMFMGDTPGGRPRDESCYVDGRVNYSQVREKAVYQKGIIHLRHAWERQASVALLCSEMKPHKCHRSKPIGNTLCEQHIDVAHIDAVYTAQTPSLRNTLTKRIQPWNGGLDVLFQKSLTIDTKSSKCSISRNRYVPDCSTGYWLPDKKLSLFLDSNGKPYYTYKTGSQITGKDFSIPFVGCSDPASPISPGTLVRVSLARWLLAGNEARCYLQISGCYL